MDSDVEAPSLDPISLSSGPITVKISSFVSSAPEAGVHSIVNTACATTSL
jgi:hypothetical protein